MTVVSGCLVAIAGVCVAMFSGTHVYSLPPTTQFSTHMCVFSAVGAMFSSRLFALLYDRLQDVGVCC